MKWLVLAGAIALVACGGEGPAEPVSTSSATEPLGTATLHWTLMGRADDAACTDERAAVIDVALVSPDTGGVLASFQEPCASFVTSLPLAPGRYAARARLLDTNGEPRSQLVELAPFTIEDASVVVQEIVFAPIASDQARSGSGV
ncbi:MAG: hypothetical protein KIT84_10880 [Labilithrix sp.]|nr:hypothetical protein [Labilithrix sp.]MCW5811511.1 hypothetical protein [Labilithrix sp.]